MNQVAASLGETGVEVIVDPPKSNSVSGRLIDLVDIWRLPSAVAQFGKHPPPVIVRLMHATGDEEVAGLASQYQVTGIILMHSIPHLSHLSIRARQERLPLVAIVNPESEMAKTSHSMIGLDVELVFTAGGAELRNSDDSKTRVISRLASYASEETQDTFILRYLSIETH